MTAKSLMVVLSLGFCLSSAILADVAQEELYDTSLLNAQREILSSQTAVDHDGDVMIDSVNSICEPFVNKHFPWQHGLGDRRFAADLSVDAYVFGDCDQLKSGMTAKISGMIFEKSLPLADASVVLTAQGSLVSAEAQMLVLGYEIGKVSRSHEALLYLSGNPQQNIDWSGDYHAFIGPFPVAVKYGAAGKVSFPWQVGVGITSINSMVTPHADTDGYVIGGSSVQSVARVELKGRMKLIDDEVKVESRIGLSASNQQTVVKADVQVNNSMAALSGAMTGLVEALDKTLYNKEFFRWDGYSMKRKVVEYSYAMPIKKLP